ncbi:unnamed protein product [Heligmosomoides polygyrus]|uniref:VWFA domain-containing protein n=1 Tax=Heligmosomoides polygyrus TaxID=6339 RepID=A0A183GJZ3_HELPZ|nr:unnamed protein product [Heligmosomoides polygyrus]
MIMKLLIFCENKAYSIFCMQYVVDKKLEKYRHFFVGLELFKCGGNAHCYASDEFREEAEVLKNDIGAEIFVVEAGDDASFDEDSQITSSAKVIRIPRWRGTDSEVLGPIADAICKIAPPDPSREVTWPARKSTVLSSVPARSCTQIDYQADVIIMLDASENFSPDAFEQMRESVAELVDAGFDLAPDVVRVGFVVYSIIIIIFFFFFLSVCPVSSRGPLFWCHDATFPALDQGHFPDTSNLADAVFFPTQNVVVPSQASFAHLLGYRRDTELLPNDIVSNAVHARDSSRPAQHLRLHDAEARYNFLGRRPTGPGRTTAL